jgi:hypothetical protein
LGSNIVGALGSVLMCLSAGLVYAVGRIVGIRLGVVLAAAAASAFLLTWTAVFLLAAERIVATDFAYSWAVWFAAIAIAGGPIYWVNKSRQEHGFLAERLTTDQEGMSTALGIASSVQSIGGLVMFFSDAAMSWWRWLPI